METVVLTFIVAFVSIFIVLATGPIVKKSIPVCIGLFKQMFSKNVMFTSFHLGVFRGW